MKENVEKGIRLKAILIYLVFALVCGVMILFVLNMRNNIEEQKEHIKQYNKILTLTNELVFTVNEAQSEATLYISGKRRANLRNFQNKITDVEILIDSLAKISNENFSDTLLPQVGTLLKAKGRIISELNNQFSKQISRDTIIGRFNTVDPSLDGDSLLIKTVVKDTVINKPATKNFWGRLGDVFSPKKSADTLVTVYTHVTDTLKLSEEDKKEILSEVSGLAEQISQDYSNRLNAIERQVGRLIQTDQEINVQLSVLLNSLSRKALDATFEEILHSEQLIRKNYNFSIYGGIMAFLLILFLILLIINDVNKGKAARKALQQVIETRRQLLLSVSHDIKSPLNSILGMVDRWKNKHQVPETEVKVLENSGQYILALLNNLLEFSNIQQGELSVSKNDFNIRKFSSEIVAMFEPLASRKKLVLVYKFDIDGKPVISGDEIKMKQIVINILSNAIKYTKEGEVRFFVKYHRDRVLFKIADTGVGIPEESMVELYKPFRRIERNNSLAHGSGLGMYVVKGLVDLLEGDITVRSEQGKGTSVDILLPVSPSQGESLDGLPQKVLVLDDDESVLCILQDIISQAGCEVSVCSNPEDFGDQVNPAGYDLIITDMEMGMVSGLDILKISKKFSPEIPVAVMTGRSDYNIDKARKEGFNFYLPKPVSRLMINRLLNLEETEVVENSTLEQLFENDKESLKEVLEVFISSTRENIDELQLALDSDNFVSAQSISHKMLSVFMQIDAVECVEILRWMDVRTGTLGQNHPEWKSKVINLIDLAEKEYDKMKKLIE